MYNVIRKFFALHHHLSLPDIGSFSVDVQPACIDFTDRTVSSSQNNIVFSDKKLPVEEKFYGFISAELNLNETEAVQCFTDFNLQLQHDLDNNSNIYFKGIGRLTKQTENMFVFEPEELPQYFPSLEAERIIRKNATHIVRVGEDERTSEEMQTVLQQPGKIKKEKWWVAAIILAVIGTTAIFLYYAMN